MAERYRNLVSDQGAQQARMQNTITPASTGLPIANAIGGAGEQIQRLGAIQQKKQEELDMTRAEQANNEYMKALIRYTNDPDTGIFNTKKNLDASGVTQAFESESLSIAGKVAADLKLTPQQKTMFERVALRTAMPYYTATQTHEANQIEAYKDTEFKTAIELYSQQWIANPGDETTKKVVAVNTHASVALRMMGASEEAINTATNRILSNNEREALLIIAQDDPKKAQAMAEKSTYLSPSDRAFVEAKLKGDVEKVEMYKLVDAALKEHPYGSSEFDGITWIRENASSPEAADRAVSHYRQRLNEFGINDAIAAEQKRQAQEKRKSDLEEEYILQNRPVPSGLLYTLRIGGKIDQATYDYFVGKNQDIFDCKKIDQRIESDPQYINATEEGKFAAKRETRGITAEQSIAYANSLRIGIMSGTKTRSDITAAKNGFLISPRDADHLNEIAASFGKEQQAFFDSQRKELESTLDKKLRGSGIVPPELKSAILGRFGELVKDLNPAAANYRESVVKAGQTAVAEGYDFYDGKKGSDLKKLVEGYAAITRYNENADNKPYKDAFSWEPSASSFNLRDAFNGMLVQGYAETKDKGYSWGAKGLNNKDLDCSGLVSGVGAKVMQSMNEVLGVEVFDKKALAALSGNSGRIIKNISQATGWERLNPSLQEIKPGMIIGLDAGARDSGYKGIDHVAIVLQNPGTGTLMVHESASGKGVRLVRLDSYVSNYRNKGRDIYLVNPLLMAKDPRIDAAQNKKKDVSKSVGPMTDEKKSEGPAARQRVADEKKAAADKKKAAATAARKEQEKMRRRPSAGKRRKR